jgi:hypothetical protein
MNDEATIVSSANCQKNIHSERMKRSGGNAIAKLPDRTISKALKIVLTAEAYKANSKTLLLE